MALPSDTTQALTNDYNAGVAAGNTGLTNLISSQNAAQTQTKANLNTQYGIPDLTNQIQGYKDTIRGIQTKLATLPADVAARDKGTLTNQAQLNRQTTAEAAPMQTNMSLAGIAEAPLNERLTSAQNDITQQMAMLSDQQARELTGYTTNNQNTLNALLDKLQNQRTLDATEAAQANALAVQQKNFEDQQELNRQQVAAATETAKAKQANDLALQQQSADLALRNSTSTTNATNANNLKIANLMNPVATPTTATPAANSGNLSRVGNTNNVTVGGWSGSRESAADRISGSQDRNSVAWQTAYKQILGEFPDINQPNNLKRVISGGAGW